MSDLQNNLFSTGYFKFLDFYGSIHASQMNHFENEDWDDCVINRDFGYDYDGYVSNVGKNLTINISHEYLSDEYINRVKDVFIPNTSVLQNLEVVSLDVDIFDLFHLSTKEDIYTFCLREFLVRSRDFRAKTAKEWGFTDPDEDYYVFRKSIPTNKSDERNKIIPDLVLFNKSHVAVIESKMYSSEGYGQTIDYEKAKEDILKVLLDDESVTPATMDFYYFTLLGVNSASDKFIVKKWSDYYISVLSDHQFKDITLELIRSTILSRAKGYKDFEENYREKQYVELTRNPNSWISPCSLFSTGLLDSEWKLDSSKITTESVTIHGVGHETFSTNFYNSENYKVENTKEDNIWLFTRIEWKQGSVDIFVNWEYWEKNDDGGWKNYYSFRRLSEERKLISVEDKAKCIAFLRDKLVDGISIPSQKKNMLHMLKASIEIQNQTIGELIDEIRSVLIKYEEYKTEIHKRLSVKDGFIRFSE